MQTMIILIGPIGAGKTAVGRLLSKKLELPLCSLDEVRDVYYEKLGYDKVLAANIAASDQGIRGVLRYAQAFDAQMIEMVLADYAQNIIDFGASNSVYEDTELLSQVERVLAPYPNVILLLPSPDEAESAEILKNRLIKMLTEASQTFSDELFTLNRHFIQQPSNYRLAKQIIYTKDKMPAAICEEIVQNLV